MPVSNDSHSARRAAHVLFGPLLVIALTLSGCSNDKYPFLPSPGSDVSDGETSSDALDLDDSSLDSDADAVTPPDGEGDADVRPGVPNGCGGEGELLYEGAPASTGDPCGCEGRLICQNRELTCLGSGPQNACGGCVDLGADRALGAACGPCRDGAWACDGGDSLICDRASAGTNVCGGCTNLGSDEPSTLCEDEDGTGLWICTSTDSLSCIGAGRNDCGGLTTLDGTVGAPCGVCGAGRYVCAGRDSVTCSDENGGLNACGGCAVLAGEPDASCGSCGGTWQCHSGNPNRVVCSAPSRNACGGCDELAGGSGPGETCDDGATFCDGPNELGCGAAESNACGGRDTLDMAPGAACGECGDGVAVCAGRDAVVCIEATPVNDCGTCERLSGAPRSECAYNHEWRCNTTGNVSCVPIRRTGVVDESGGTVTFGGTSEEGRVTLTAPAGSIDEPIAITVERTEFGPIPGLELTSPVYRFSPEGARFDPPITVRIETSETVDVGLWWSESDGDDFVRVPSRIVGGTVEGQVDHFSLGVAARTEVAPECRAEPPVARATCTVLGSGAPATTDVLAEPLDTLRCSADGSSASSGGLVEYAWSVVDRPGGSVTTFSQPGSSSPNLFLDLIGRYVVELQVVDSRGCTAISEPVTVFATSNEDVHLQLTWYAPADPDPTDTGHGLGPDVDLHFLHPNGCWEDSEWDVHFRNTNPNWGDPGSPVDDPSLDIDSTDGSGPENISFNIPENGADYTIGVHYFNDWGFGESLATVRVYLFGALAFEARDKVLDGTGQWWVVAEISWPSGAVTAIDEVFDGLPTVGGACE